MYAIESGGLFLGGPAGLVSGITDMLLVETAAGVRLITTTRAGGGVMVLSTGTGGLRLIDSEVLPASPTLPAPARLDLLTVGGQLAVCVTGGNCARLEGFGLDGAGGLGAAVRLVGSPAGALVASAGITLASGQMLFHARGGEAGVIASRLNADGTVTEIGRQSLGPDWAGIDIAALETVRIDGVPFLLALSSARDGLLAFRIGANGQLELRGTLGAEGGLGIAAPTALEVVETGGGRVFALVAAAGSSSLSVVELSAGGEMRLADHVIDTLDTRFQGIQAVETVRLGDRVFVIAGGGDGGITVMLLEPDGRLLDVAEALDGAGRALGSVSSIAARAVDGRIEIHVAGEGAGITRLVLDPGVLEPRRVGSDAADRMIGATGGDDLDGRSGNDRLEGGAGDDILRDGAGTDTLIGGAGRDLFVMSADGMPDLVNDFEVGRDRIDLTAWGRVYSLEALNIRSVSTGAVLSFGDEYLTIRSPDMTPIPVSAFSAGDFFGLWHLAHEPEQGRRLTGTGEADVLRGGGGDDVLVGSGGADVMDGGSGFDTADYSGSRTRLWLDMAQEAQALAAGGRGPAAGDRLVSVEAVIGGRKADVILGTDRDNLLSGRGGDDRLTGRKGDDVLDGGEGDDRLAGGLGADTLTGGAGSDTALYHRAGAAVRADLSGLLDGLGEARGDVFRGIENLQGSRFADWLRGDAGANRIAGNGGADDLRGGGGNDLLTGGDGADRIDGGPGADRLVGGAGADAFVFLSGGGSDRIADARLTQGDRLLLDDALVPRGWDAADLLRANARLEGNALVLAFSNGQSLTLDGITSLNGWANAIDFV